MKPHVCRATSEAAGLTLQMPGHSWGQAWPGPRSWVESQGVMNHAVQDTALKIHAHVLRFPTHSPKCAPLLWRNGGQSSQVYVLGWGEGNMQVQPREIFLAVHDLVAAGQSVACHGASHSERIDAGLAKLTFL